VVSLWSLGAHLGHLEAILEDLEQQEAKRGQQEAKREAKSEIWWSKQGRQGSTEGAPRGDEGRRGFGSAAWGRQMGDIGGSSWRVLGEDSARPDHAKAWGGGFKMPSAHAADLF
jgi:hypothetical protein